ncbi:MAG: transposase [bacterium]
MYEWRQASPDERRRILHERRLKGQPWHSPPHIDGPTNLYHICVACYEHKPYIGTTLERLQEFSSTLLVTLAELAAEIFTWCILPNHYHVQLRLDGGVKNFIKELGKFHGGTSFRWNGEENCRGRKIWCNTIDRWIRDERHFWTALNYIHHNPVKHGLVQKWQEWPFSSARDYLNRVGKEKAREIWFACPVKDYGSDWLGTDL